MNSSDLINNGRTDRDALKEKLRELLDSMTYDKLMEIQSTRAEQIQKQLKYVPVPNGKAIFLG
jgi:predicted nucleotidyltransferase component of viral defense system